MYSTPVLVLAFLGLKQVQVSGIDVWAEDFEKSAEAEAKVVITNA